MMKISAIVILFLASCVLSDILYPIPIEGSESEIRFDNFSNRMRLLYVIILAMVLIQILYI